ncbi:response regulator [Azospirillum doebereinerae]|uniref:histidine kinase n=1 Tax=Azospirillum doebereinerae TaxID=92933 RepID=A0A3S0WU38_9PROT|nr:response regulator [Azospirillum doebereinerae]RUQ69260.1 response regulator [Azospirillum doebereinerae]
MIQTPPPDLLEDKPVRLWGWNVVAPVVLALGVGAGTLWLAPAAVGRETLSWIVAVSIGLAAAGLLAAATAHGALRRRERDQRRAQALAAWRADASLDDSLDDASLDSGETVPENAPSLDDLRVLLHALEDAAVLLDSDGWVLAANPAAVAALGAAAAPEIRWDDETIWPAALVLERLSLPGGGAVIVGRDPLRERLRTMQLENMDAMAELAGAIVHDVNNTLGAIAGYADFLVTDLPDGSPQADYAARILRAIDHNKSLLRRALSGSRAAPVDMRPTTADHVLGSAAAELRAALPPDAALSLREAPDLPAVPGNAAVLAHGLALLGAELRGTGDAALGLRAMLWDGTVNPAVAPAGWQVHAPLLPRRRPHVMFELRIGVAPRPIPALRATLDPLLATRNKARQADAEPPPALTSVARWHDGGLVVWTHPAEGTLVRLFVPLAADPAPRVPPEPKPEAPPAALRCHVLVVDDDPAMGDWLAISLERLGCEVAVCESGGEALEIVMDEPESFDVVVAGPSAGGMTGPALIVRLKALRPELSCVLCGEPAGEPHVGAVPADLFLPRPLNIAGLTRAVATFAPAERSR